MTRETRIALLVGLAFIVLFGLVLGQRSMNLQSQSPALATKTPSGPLNNVIAEESRPSNEVTNASIPDSSHAPVVSAPAPHPEGEVTPPRIPVDPHVAIAPSAPGHAVTPTPSVTPAPGAKPADPTVAIAPPTTPAEPTVKNVIEIARPDEPTGKTYKVEPGDTIFKIAKKLNMGNDGPAKLMAMNKDRVKDVTALKIGQEILVPGDGAAKVVSVKSDTGKSGLAIEIPKPAVVKPAAADVPALSPGNKSNLAIVEKPADDKRALSAPNIKGDDGSLVKAREDTKAAPADKNTKSSLDKLDEKLNGKADPAVAGKTYKVRQGDNLYSIANDQMGSRTKAAVQKLMQANGIKDPSKLVAGAELKIPKAS